MGWFLVAFSVTFGFGVLFPQNNNFAVSPNNSRQINLEGGSSLSPALSNPLRDPLSVISIDLRANFNLGLNFVYRKSYDLAILYFLDTLKKDPDHFWARYYLGFSFYKLGQNDEAIREWENLIKLGQDSQALREKINKLYKGQDISDREKSQETYVWIQNYPNDSQTGIGLSIPINLELNEKNELVVLDFASGSFFKIDSRGDIIFNNFNFRENIAFFKPFNKPWDFHRVGNDYWVTDFSLDQIQKVNFNQAAIASTIGKKGWKEGELLGPKGLTGDENGNLWVVDSGNSRIQYFNQEGKYLRSFGKRGRDLGEFLNPDDIVYHQPTKSLLVSDKGNKWVAQYNLQGDLQQLIGRGQFTEPSKLDIIKGNQLMILDRNKIFKYFLDEVRNGGVSQEIDIKQENEAPPTFTSFVFGDNNYLYLGNAAKKKIEVYAPIEFTYVNWNVMIENIEISQFPVVNLEISVKDPLGNPIPQIASTDIRVYENGYELPHQVYAKPDQKRFVLLVEETEQSLIRKDLMTTFLNEMFDGLKNNDKLKIIGFNEKGYQEKTDFNEYRLVTINRTLKGEFTDNYLIGGAYKRGVVDLANKQYDNAIILVMFSPLTFKANENVDFEMAVNLAKNNQVPVYVFYLGDERLEKSKNFNYLARKLTEETGGKYYEYDINRVKKFYEDNGIYDNGLYRIRYKTVPNAALSTFHRRVKVVVRHKKNLGEDGMMIYPIP